MTMTCVGRWLTTQIRALRRARIEALSIAAIIALTACSKDDASGDHNNPIGDGDGDGDGGTAGDGDGDGDGAEPTVPPPEDEDDEEDEQPPEEEPECDAESPVVLYLSPDDSNSMSSPVQAREAVLTNWNAIWSVPIRTWEFMNYYDFGYPAAPEGELDVHASALPLDAAEGNASFAMQIAVSSPSQTNAERAPVNVTFVLDTSGSMAGHSMDMLKATCEAVAGQLREGDMVSLVTWSVGNDVVLTGHEVDGPDDPVLLGVIDGLSADGSTDLQAGLAAGYELASSQHDPSAINRLILISDGDANVGVTEEEIIAEHAGDADAEGIYLVGVGVGDASVYNDLMMDRVTDVGRGASVFINTEAEAQQVFGEDFVNTLSVAARDVRIVLDLPPGFEVKRFSGEEIGEDPEEIEPQHIAPNDAMVFYQTLDTCAPELAGDDAVVTITAKYRDAITFEPKQVVRELTIAELDVGESPQMAKGRAVFDYAEALRTFQGTNDDSPVSIDEAFESLELAEALAPDDPELAEIRLVLETLAG